ncbi:hypothetical protein [Cryobacterium aureum]|uniref:hypothetical protein n=1 Tax=Cryobacterium aureum TaxID=995037 RepID=UPI00196A4D8A|nr:hypothetical protein [Cryobacterium aureum]
MDTLTFRRVTTDDVPALLVLVTNAYRGYQRTGVQKPFHSDTRFGVPRRDDLQLEVLEKVLQHG